MCVYAAPGLYEYEIPFIYTFSGKGPSSAARAYAASSTVPVENCLWRYRAVGCAHSTIFGRIPHRKISETASDVAVSIVRSIPTLSLGFWLLCPQSFL